MDGPLIIKITIYISPHHLDHPVTYFVFHHTVSITLYLLSSWLKYASPVSWIIPCFSWLRDEERPMVLEPSIELSLCKINKVINILELYCTYIN